MDKKSNGELDEEERKAPVSQRILCNKGEERWDGATCDFRREAAVVRVGAALKTSDKGVYAKGIVLVVVSSG